MKLTLNIEQFLQIRLEFPDSQEISGVILRKANHLEKLSTTWTGYTNYRHNDGFISNWPMATAVMHTNVISFIFPNKVGFLCFFG